VSRVSAPAQFSVTIPELALALARPEEKVAIPSMEPIADDAGDVRSGDRVLLIVENDVGFARFLLDVARERGFKGVLAHQGGAALAIARDVRPAAISLDINLPDIDGWRVLDRLKHDLAMRHIPVQIIT